MKYDFYELRKYFVSLFALLTLVATFAVVVAQGQNPRPPRREQLLNGLRLLMWNDASNPVLTVRLRVHSGAAFDVKGKEGTMRLLADMMIDDQTRNYFQDELGGKITVESNFDFLEITATARADEGNLVRVLDVLRTSAANLPIAPDNFKRVRDARLQKIQTTPNDNAALADAAIKKQLFGEFFPYGRTPDGTAATLLKIDHVDLIQARDRFLTADNVTLAIAGNFNPTYAFRAVRQIFGSWKKADKPVPATFRQPEAADAKILFVRQPSVERAEIRFAVRGAARNSADFAAAEILAAILHERWRNALPAELKESGFVRHEAHVLPGITIFGASVQGGFAEPFAEQLQSAYKKIWTEAISTDEFNRAKSKINTNEDAPSVWLNADTFKLKSPESVSAAVNAVTVAQVQTLLAAWQKQTPAAVAVTQGEGNPPANKT